MSLRTDVEQPLLDAGAEQKTSAGVNGRFTLDRARAVLVPKRKMILAIQVACIMFYVVALFNMHDAKTEAAEGHHGLVKRKVINGHGCARQRSQLGVFMASFFGGMFAADQLWARNWQLAVPKILFFFLGGPIAAVATLFTGLSLHFAWWLIDVVMWGVGYYLSLFLSIQTTDTHWGNPTKGCAVRGW